MEDNRCVACGSIIPEGRQVCQKCESNTMNDNVLKMLSYDTKVAFTVTWMNEIKRLVRKIEIMWEN